MEFLLSLSVYISVLILRRIGKQNLDLLQNLHNLLKNLEVFVSCMNRAHKILAPIINRVVLLQLDVFHYAGRGVQVVLYANRVLFLIRS